MGNWSRLKKMDITSKYSTESLVGFWLEGKTAVKAVRRQSMTSVGEGEEKSELTTVRTSL